MKLAPAGFSTVPFVTSSASFEPIQSPRRPNRPRPCIALGEIKEGRVIGIPVKDSGVTQSTGPVLSHLAPLLKPERS